MLKFVFRRILHGIVVVIGLSILIFVISRVIPGDPVRLLLGPGAPQFAVDQLRKEMYLDKSIPVQYYYWFTGILRGDFGRSINTRRPVIEDIKDLLPATLELALFSGMLLVVFSIALGLLATKYCDTWVEGTISVLSYVGISIPNFVIAVLLLLIFGHLWPILPTLGRLSVEISAPKSVTGMLVIDSLIAGNFSALFGAIKGLLLPSIALSTPNIFQVSRLIRSSMKDNIGKEYISVATGYGIPRGLILRKYLLKPSFIPVVSIIGLCIASFIGLAFIIELIFHWPGLSRYGMEAMLTKDLNVVSAVVIITGIAFLVTNIIVDFIVAFLDPRIRLGGNE